MLDFVKRAFRGGINVLLWINLILCTIGGGVAGYYLAGGWGYAFGGVLIGIILGLLSNIIGGGFIATIISIDENIENLAYNSSMSDSNKKTINNNDTTYNEWQCSKCGTVNEISLTTCKKCGKQLIKVT